MSGRFAASMHTHKLDSRRTFSPRRLSFTWLESPKIDDADREEQKREFAADRPQSFGRLGRCFDVRYAVGMQQGARIQHDEIRDDVRNRHSEISICPHSFQLPRSLAGRLLQRLLPGVFFCSSTS
jgi:hypothetical protein